MWLEKTNNEIKPLHLLLALTCVLTAKKQLKTGIRTSELCGNKQ